MFKLRMVGQIIKDAGLVHLTVLFGVVFLACTAAVLLLDQEVDTLGDSLWFCYQAVSTIGFGDIEVSRPTARIATVALSVFSIFYLAVVTGAVVSYCMAAASARRKENLMHFMDQLEHVDQLSHDELVELAAQVRDFRRKNGAASGAAGTALDGAAASGADVAAVEDESMR